MADPTHESPNFDFKDIFPNCIKEYNDIKKVKDQDDFNSDEFFLVCRKIERQLEIKMDNFKLFCVFFSNYLQHINTKGGIEKEPYCKYFNYLIKYLLYNHPGSSCSEERDCYNKMINIFEGDRKNDMNICVPYVNDLEENVYKLLDYLNYLYNYLEKLRTHYITCESNTHCFQNYTDFLRMCKEMNNNSLKVVMNMVKDEYKQYIPIEPETIHITKKLQSSSMISAPKVIIIVCIITLTTTFIPFILFKVNNKLYLYINTSCRLYIEKMIRKLKKFWHKKSKQNLKLLNQFENDFEELMDKNSQIIYNTLYYP
ncbi:variable surface protein [Plasmodium gonderi]|uniref:Variable surface protein n=1 Tax=Plasmodium gonderi TaxID=77519 RepID=A0A1Y1JPK6_PLAGO|nr:variable surface protein [Plasmodium gonderi]GAW84401.1 variable surface protein [Plasmodium gonderi]